LNEKIKSLAEQAGIHFETGKQNRIHFVNTDTLEKFAELITQECIDVVKPTDHHEVWAQSYLGGVDGLDLLYSKIKDIKKHFGVENE
jgi:hypothetical protein